MNKNGTLSHFEKSMYTNLLRNNITPLDLFILTKINAGVKAEDLYKQLSKEFKISNPEKTFNERFQKLFSEQNPQDRVLVNNAPRYIINPSKMYDNILLLLIKANLPSFEATLINQGLGNINLKDIFDVIMEINKKPQFGNPIHQLYTLIGWDYDFLGIVVTNDIEKFQLLRDYLISMGIVNSIKPIPIATNKGFFFEPTNIPDYNEFRRFLVNFRERVDEMISDVTEQDILMAKTEQYFQEIEYGVEALSGINKGDIYPLEKTKVNLGRFQDNDIVINKDDLRASRRHARIMKIDNKYILEDDSLNGTLINDKKINHSEKELHDGDRIKIGETEYKFIKIKKKT